MFIEVCSGLETVLLWPCFFVEPVLFLTLLFIGLSLLLGSF